MRVMDPEPVVPDFAFAFDDSNFSDRLLTLEILPGPSSSKPLALSDWAHNRKRRRHSSGYMIGQGKEEERTAPETDEDAGIVAAYDSLDDEPEAMIEEPSASASASKSNTGRVGIISSVIFAFGINFGGVLCMFGCCILSEGDDSAASGRNSSWNTDSVGVLRVRNIHISSPILAARSPFFYKLFSNGMRESEQRRVTLQLLASEEAAFLDLLNFMYSNTLATKTPTALLDVLMAADKYEVASCMRECSRLLRDLPMTSESALLYLELPTSVLMAEAVQPLTDAAKRFLAAHYRDINKFTEEVLNLPLAGIEAVLSSDDLQIASEDAVYDFVLKWSRLHYPKIEERRQIITSRLGRLIRFPFMTCRRLKRVLSSSDFDPEFASKVVLDALFFKGETPHRQRRHAEEETNTSYRCFVERAYRYRPVKVLEFELPRQQCIVYLDLKREECHHLFPTGRVYSQAFHQGGQGFFLSAHCNMDQQNNFHCFGLFLGMQEKGSVSFAVEYEFAAREKPSEDFSIKYKGNYTFTGGKAVGYRNLFGIPWTSFISDESPYFIKDVLHLRAQLTLRL